MAIFVRPTRNLTTQELAEHELSEEPYVPSPQAEAVVRSASVLAQGIVGLHGSETLEKHLRELLSVIVWKITEAHGKHNLRYRSLGILQKNAYLEPGTPIHEHVHTRLSLAQRMVRGTESVEEVLADALACLVTRAEDKLLRKVPNHIQGWERYRRVRIAVFDMQERLWVLPPS